MATGYDLLAIYRLNAAFVREEQTRVPSACPNDGTPLETGPDGRLHCRHDGWIWDGTPLVYQL